MFDGKPHCPVCGGHFSFDHKKNEDGSTRPCPRPEEVDEQPTEALARARPSVPL